MSKYSRPIAAGFRNRDMARYPKISTTSLSIAILAIHLDPGVCLQQQPAIEQIDQLANYNHPQVVYHKR